MGVSSCHAFFETHDGIGVSTICLDPTINIFNGFNLVSLFDSWDGVQDNAEVLVGCESSISRVFDSFMMGVDVGFGQAQRHGMTFRQWFAVS